MGLPDSEFWILYVLATNEPEMLQTELTAITGVSKTTINSALKKMERAGLLELTPGGGRNTCARLTEIGHQLAEKTVCRLVALENRIYESWSPEEQAMLIQLNCAAIQPACKALRIAGTEKRVTAPASFQAAGS